MTKKQLAILLTQKRAALAALFAAHPSATGAVNEYADTLPLDQVTTLGNEIATYQTQWEAAPDLEAIAMANTAALATLQQTATTYSHAAGGNIPGGQNPTVTGFDDFATKNLVLPASAKRYRGGSFKDANGRPDAKKAYLFGVWCLAVLTGAPKFVKMAGDFGVPIVKVATEGINTAGGALVPEQFDNDLIDLREKYGVFRPNAKLSNMFSDTKTVPRRTGGLTAYFVGEDQQITDSTKGWDNVRLVAKKIACLAKYSNELNEDAIIDIGNDLAQEIAYAFSQKEDDCGFNGDGTSTYGGIVGVRTALTNLSGTIANIAGLVVASGTGYATDYSSVLLANLNKVKAKLPKYARPKAKWFCNQYFYDAVMEELLVAAGGVTVAQIQAASGSGTYGDEPHFLGFPVVTSQIFPANSAVNQVACLFGDLSLAALFGDRRETTIAMSEHAGFANDELQIRGTERFDINVHDVGNANATASLRAPGPIVGLITAAS